MSRPAFRYGEPRSPRKMSKAVPGWHFRGQAIHLLCRLRDHIERLDSGVVYAVDDIAVTLRAFLNHTRGNRVLLRLADLAQQHDVEIRLSRPPAHNAIFSVGAIPTTEPGSEDHGAEWIEIDRWASRPVLRMKVQSKPITFTWGEFLNVYANKWGGAHLDPDLPEPLQIIDLYEVGALPLSAYLLRTAAVQTWFVGQALLAEHPLMVRSGKPLTVEEKMSVRIAAPGGIADDPVDRRPDGELQFLDYRADGLDVLSYVTPHRKTTMRLQMGKMSWNMECTPGSGAVEPASQTTRAREPVAPTLRSSDFSERKTIPVRGQFLPFSDAS